MSKPKKISTDAIKRQFPGDKDDTAIYEPFTLILDDDGTVWLYDKANHLMLSYVQAMALHQQLGQVLMQFDRPFGVHINREFKVHTNAK